MKADTAKRIPTTIVVIKRNFSNPRRVWYSPPPSPPPSAPPTPAPDCCSSIATTKIIDSIICIYGNIVAIIVIKLYYYIEGKNANQKTCN